MKVKVFSTQMGEKEVETGATTWGELQTDLKKSGISFSKMKAVIGENKLTLEADGAMLPAQGFTLFLMNKKTKAGANVSALSYKQLRKTISVILQKDGEAAKEYFNEGKNYTTKSTDILRDLLSSYSGIVPSIKECEDFIPSKITKSKKKKSATVIKKDKAVASKPKKIKGNKTPEPVMRPVDEPKVINKDTVKKVKKANPVIEEANKAVADVVESVKESKEDEVHHIEEEAPIIVEGHIGLLKLDEAVAILKEVMIHDLDRLLQEDVEALTQRLARKATEATEIYSLVAEAKAKKAEEERLAKLKAQEEAAEAEQKRAEEEAKEKAEKEEEDRLAKEKSDAEAKVAEEKAAHDRDMRNQMDNLASEFSDVR
jgi:hypothetical protein